jgi:integrase
MALTPSFTDELGRRLHPNVLTDAFRRICERLGLNYRLHDMRHTAATFMLHAGKDLSTVQQILGHSQASTTLNIYGHVLKGAKADAIQALDRMLWAGSDEDAV